MRIGSGFFDILHKPLTQSNSLINRELLFDNQELHEAFSYEIDGQHAPQFE